MLRKKNNGDFVCFMFFFFSFPGNAFFFLFFLLIKYISVGHERFLIITLKRYLYASKIASKAERSLNKS